MPVGLRAPHNEELPQLAQQLGLDTQTERAVPLNLVHDVRVAELDGQLVGSCWTRVIGSVTVFSADGTEAYVRGQVLSEHRGKGIGTALLAWLLERVSATPTVHEVFTAVPEADADALALLHAFGFKPSKTALLMLHADLGSVPAPSWPAGIRVVDTLRGEELVDAVMVACDLAFANQPNYRGAGRPLVTRVLAHPKNDPALCFVALQGAEVVGLNFCWLGRRDGETQGCVEDLGVVPAARGIGVGRALLWHGVRALAERGASSVTLGVDAANRPARRLYEQTGFMPTAAFVQHRVQLR